MKHKLEVFNHTGLFLGSYSEDVSLESYTGIFSVGESRLSYPTMIFTKPLSKKDKEYVFRFIIDEEIQPQKITVFNPDGNKLRTYYSKDAVKNKEAMIWFTEEGTLNQILIKGFYSIEPNSEPMLSQR
jgi:hypothetical protein